MPELKLKIKDLGTIHLMALDNSSEFLPFGRPIADYLRGAAGNQNGSRALLRQGPIDFSPAIRWNESIESLLRTTGFEGLEQEALVEREPVAAEIAPAESPDPAVADFLPFEAPELGASEPKPPKIAPAVALEDLPVSVPRISALPLRPRMSFGPAPAPKAKPVPVAAPAPKPVAPAPAAKAVPVVAAPPKPAPIATPKPAAPTIAPKPPAPAPVQAKPAAAPPAPKPVVAPAARVSVPQAPAVVKPAAPPAPAARASEPAPAPPKPAPVRVAVGRSSESIAAAVDAAIATPPKPSVPVSKAPATPKPPAPPVPAGRASGPSSPVEQAPAREVISREAPKPKEPEARPQPKPVETVAEPAESGFEPNLGGAEPAGFFDKIPMVAKIGAGLGIAALALYFTFGGKSVEKPAEASQAINAGEQGWSTEWASDPGGSKRARQLTMYRPSAGMSDYQLQFVGQIETKALGWVFRAFDTKNYYVMKLENYRPGIMALTHFAVVEGRESSYSQKPLAIDAHPGVAYRVKLDVSGPRFTVSIGGEPVDFWTDNRLKVGSVGFMNERDERGAASQVQFSFPKVAK